MRSPPPAPAAPQSRPGWRRPGPRCSWPPAPVTTRSSAWSMGRTRRPFHRAGRVRYLPARGARRRAGEHPRRTREIREGRRPRIRASRRCGRASGARAARIAPDDARSESAFGEALRLDPHLRAGARSTRLLHDAAAGRARCRGRIAGATEIEPAGPGAVRRPVGSVAEVERHRIEALTLLHADRAAAWNALAAWGLAHGDAALAVRGLVGVVRGARPRDGCQRRGRRSRSQGPVMRALPASSPPPCSRRRATRGSRRRQTRRDVVAARRAARARRSRAGPGCGARPREERKAHLEPRIAAGARGSWATRASRTISSGRR